MAQPETCLMDAKDSINRGSEPTRSAKGSVTLNVTGLGHVPAIKNSFHAIVDPKNRAWKKRCVKLFESTLLSSIQTTGSETLTPLSLRSLIALLPHDDNWKVIPEIHVRCLKVKPGEEGATIVITEL